jgi:hypothetical protein
MSHLMTTREYYFRAFLYRLDVFFALQRYAVEVQALQQLKKTYSGQIPLKIWHEQTRRILRARVAIYIRRAALDEFLADLRN